MGDSTAALAALVYKLQQRLDALQGAVDALQAVVNDHSGLATDLADLTQRVRALIADGEDRAGTEPAPVWFGLSREEYDGQLRQLTSFVNGHLRVAYRDYLQEVLHDCWAQHPGALWELSDLQAEWNRVYSQDPPDLAGALAWHDRWLPGVRARLVETMHGCRDDRCRHQRPQVSGWGTR